MTLRVSTVLREGIYQGSKWLKFQVLSDAEELEKLFNWLRPFFIFPLTGLVTGQPCSEDFFLKEYQSWILALSEGCVPEPQALRSILAAAFTDDLEDVWLQEIPNHLNHGVRCQMDKKYLMKIGKPLLQVQAHWFSYSKTDAVFRPMSMGSESIFWGLQFSYPQIYQDAKTMELRNVEKRGLFEKLRLWVRETTLPTPFIVNGQRINASIRLGKKCFSWIGRHPQLLAQGLAVHGY